MASINFNPFNNNWFNKPSTPFQPIILLSHFDSLKPHRYSPPFAAISNPFQENPKQLLKNQVTTGKCWTSSTGNARPRPDFLHAPEVERILNEDPIFEKKENPTPEEIEENEKWLAEFWESPVVQFLAKAEEIADKLNDLELQESSAPFQTEDKKLWQAVPNVFGLDGRPMPRKAVKTKKESDDKFWDFARQFLFEFSYTPGRPIDAAQAIVYKRLEKRYHDYCFRYFTTSASRSTTSSTGQFPVLVQ